MQETNKTRMPTGIASLDPILDGGIPPGSMILLLGEIGAGNYEFAYSSTVNSLACMNRARTPVPVARQKSCISRLPGLRQMSATKLSSRSTRTG